MPPGHVVAVLVRPRHPGNIGVAARAVAHHGLGGLVIVDPRGFDPERARWMAPGAEHVVDSARFTATVAEAVADCVHVIGTTARSRRTGRWPIRRPEEAAAAIAAERVPTAILFGPEDKGLSNEDLRLCQSIVVLPNVGPAPGSSRTTASLNLGSAVSLVAAALLWAESPEIARDDRAPGTGPPATAPLVDRATTHAIELLDRCGYLRGRTEERVRGTLYRVFARARPDQREVAAVEGMLHAIRWKLDHP